jgi:hypothetical protein
MSDSERRLLEAERALYRLELQVEQHQVHVAELGAHPCEAEKAHAVLNGLATELESGSENTVSYLRRPFRLALMR